MATRNVPSVPMADRVSSLDSARRARRTTDQGRDPVTLVIADLYQAARAGARAAVEPFGFAVVAEAADAPEAVAASIRERPQLCLIAANLPGGGLEATRTLAERLPRTTIVVLGDDVSDESLVAAVEAGATGYVPRTAAPERLPTALNSALEGYVSLPLPLFTRVVQRAASPAPNGVQVVPGLPAVRLTPREQQVLKHLLDGASTAQIALGLGVSHVTVRRYASDILRKTGVADRDALRALWQQRTAE